MNEDNHSVIDYDDIRRSAERNLGVDNKGWIEIVTRCFEGIKRHCDREELPYPRVAQIKQKFGGLRIYLHADQTSDDQMIPLFIETATVEADARCEMCGNCSRPQSVGAWIANLCCFCAQAEARRQKRNLRKHPLNGNLDHPLQCKSCGYIGQLVPGRGDKLCAACAIKSSEIRQET